MRGKPPNPLGDWWKVFAMGTVLAGLIFLTFFYEPNPPISLGEGPPMSIDPIETPQLDAAMLELARDETRQQRLTIEAKPLAHLLERSLDIVPSVAKALGIPDQPVPISRLRANPNEHRGNYYWYKGQLKYLSRGKSGHPNDRYRIHEGWLQTDEGDDVVFRVSLEPRDVSIGDYVRIEGFFMKLHDSHDLPRADQIPVLVGPQLFLDFPPWSPVTELDPEIMGGIDDSIYRGEVPIDKGEGPVWDTLKDSQYMPLWHAISFARTKSAGLNFGQWRAIPAFVTKHQLDKVKNGETERGTPFRVLGAFIQGQYWEAQPNPLGIKYWSQAWVQVQDLSGKLVPVWVPKKLDLRRNQPLEVRAFFFRRMMYDTEAGARFTPVFIADDIHEFVAPPPDSATNILKWAFIGAVLAVIAMFIFLARRDRARHAKHLTEMDERRRRRAERATFLAESS